MTTPTAAALRAAHKIGVDLLPASILDPGIAARMAELIDREAGLPDLITAAKLAVLNFTRADASGNFLGDDERESWTALERAIARAEGR
jgi:hypothetical protein